MIRSMWASEEWATSVWSISIDDARLFCRPSMSLLYTSRTSVHLRHIDVSQSKLKVTGHFWATLYFHIKQWLHIECLQKLSVENIQKLPKTCDKSNLKPKQMHNVCLPIYHHRWINIIIQNTIRETKHLFQTKKQTHIQSITEQHSIHKQKNFINENSHFSRKRVCARSSERCNTFVAGMTVMQ